MTRILFICLGNICRSPMAEYVMKDLVSRAGLSEQFKIASAATRKNSIVKCNNFLLIFLYILSHHNKAVNIHSFVGSLL